MRCVGTVIRGIRTPIIKKDDDLATIVVDSLMAAKESEGFEFRDKDIVAITEAVVGISEGNYVTVDDVAEDLQNKFPSKNIGVVNPILSRNRFSIILKGIARGMDKITLLTSFPADEVGNGILDEDILEKSDFNLASTITEDEYKKTFGSWIHPFTGINMVDFYRELIESEDCEVEFVFTNDIKTILNHTNDVLTCDIHTRFKSTKLQIEVMVYGDGAFKDPVGKIWELADPVVSPAHTSGLIGYPNEIKLKYVSDNKFADLKGDELKEAIKDEIRHKDADLTGQMITEGTTPRVLTDLIGSLCDLTSGSGDKGTPVVFIQGYFDNLADD